MLLCFLEKRQSESYNLLLRLWSVNEHDPLHQKIWATSGECSEIEQSGGGYLDDQGLIVLVCNSVILPLLPHGLFMMLSWCDSNVDGSSR